MVHEKFMLLAFVFRKPLHWLCGISESTLTCLCSHLAPRWGQSLGNHFLWFSLINNLVKEKDHRKKTPNNQYKWWNSWHDSNPPNSLRSQKGEMQGLKGFPMKTVLKTGVISFQISSLVHYFQTTTLHLFHLIGQFFLSTASLREVITLCLHFSCLLPWEQYQLQIQIYDLAQWRELKKADREQLGQTR